MFVDAVRGRTVESRHRVHAAVVDAAGRRIGAAGDPEFVTFMRSVAKPFQAVPLVADGAADAFGLTGEDLALACASHSSEPRQVELVRAFLARAGVREADLRCGPHPPLSDAVVREYAARGVALGPIHSNCSGKHAGMLALARHHGWPLADYHTARHPVQRRCLAEVSRWTGIAEDRIETATDGCGVVCFAVPLSAMAIAYARLAMALGDPPSSESRPAAPALNGMPRSSAELRGPFSSIPHSAFRIPHSMLAHPDLVAGAGRPCTELMRANPGRLIAKVGAEGVYAAALVGEGVGVALKIEDGHGGAAVLAMAALLAEFGCSVPEALRARPLTNSRGETVGELRVKGAVSR